MSKNDFSVWKLAYGLALWIMILLEEHFIFRQKTGLLGGYDVHAYDSPALSVSIFFLMSLSLILPFAVVCQSGLPQRMFNQNTPISPPILS